MAGAVSPTPSFHLCPDFNIAPPPNGHLQLGSVLRGLDADGVLTPLDIGATVPVPESQLYPRNEPQAKTGFSRSLRELRSVETSIWAKIFGSGLQSPGAVFSSLRKREGDETLTVERLLIRYFIPTADYMKQALEIDGVAFHVRNTKRRKPVYLITGLMWTEGAKLSNVRSKQTSLSGQVAAADLISGASGGVRAAYESEDNLASGFDGSTPFVLGIRVRKIWWDKEGTRHDEHDTIGATLGDDDEGETGVLQGLRYVDDEDLYLAGQTFAEQLSQGDPESIRWVLPSP